MDSRIHKSRLFTGMDDGELKSCLDCCGAATLRYRQGAILFQQGDQPTRLFVLLEGIVSVCQDTSAGKRTLLASFDTPGDLFGEVYAFLDRAEYEQYALAESDVTVLELPKAFLYKRCGQGCAHHSRLTQNMLAILAEKAYAMNRKVQLLSLPTLRHKVAALVLRNAGPDGVVRLRMTREEMADYLGVARPSLSRELLRMQDEGLLTLDGRRIALPDRALLEELL